jgi:hypothetical protein
MSSVDATSDGKEEEEEDKLFTRRSRSKRPRRCAAAEAQGWIEAGNLNHAL